jgi:hypothetical protein
MWKERMSMHRLIVTGVLTGALWGCVAAQPWTADKPLQARQQDVVECTALAAQAAQGAGAWSSDPIMRAAFFENARDQYLAICLQSRGWYQGQPAPQTSFQTPPGTPISTPPMQEERVFRQCTQVALGKLGLWDGPVDGEASPARDVVWQRYVESRKDLVNDQRQAQIRMVINHELAAIHQSIDWWGGCS